MTIPPEQRLNDLLLAGNLATIATAESCSSGRVAHRITAIAGSSEYFLGGIVAYANSAKETLLGVPAATLANPGAVSAECARAMAEGACRAFGADVAVATTGIAGPGGGTARKPVGLVYTAVAGVAGADVTEHRFSGTRGEIVEAAADAALHQLVRYVERLAAARPA